MHDLKIVPILDCDLPDRRARDNRGVALDRDSQRVEPEFLQQIGNADAAGDPTVLAIHADGKGVVSAHIG